MRRSFCGLIPLILALLAGCASVHTTSGGVVGVDREQSMLVSADSVNRSADQAYRKTLAAAQAKERLNRDPETVRRVRLVAGRLVSASVAFRADAPKWHWEANVITSNELNAWCMPGGKIAVYTGLVDRLALSDDELAAVMGHEIAHALREHGREKAGQAQGLNIATSLGGAILGAYLGIGSGVGQQALGAVGDYAFMRPNSREMEQEADRIGIELAARAGYDPHAAIRLWEKMERVSGGTVPEWMSTHPSHESRIADLRDYAERVMPLYRASHVAK